jgi:hypothetical protein
MKTKVTKEDLQNRLNEVQKMIDNFKEETKLEVGKWYKTENGRITFLESFESCKGYGFNHSNWHNTEIGFTFISDPEDWNPATNKEVEDALIKEAKKRGFKDGITVIRPNEWGEVNNNVTLSGNEFNFNGNWFGTYKGRRLFKDGVWAEIIEDKKPKICGFEMEFVEDGHAIKFGCKTFTTSRVKALYKNMQVLGVHHFSIEGNGIKINELKEVVDYLNK